MANRLLIGRYRHEIRPAPLSPVVGLASVSLRLSLTLCNWTIRIHKMSLIMK